MAATWQFALFFFILLMVSRSPSLAINGTKQITTTSSVHETTASGGGGGHGASPITTLPIVTWKWEHVSEPYLVALWVLVCWLCKLGESYAVLSVEG